MVGSSEIGARKANRSKAYKAGINTDESRRRRELVQRCVPASARQQHAAASPAQRTLADRNNHTISAEEHDGAAHEADAAHEHEEMECPVCMEAINEADAAMRCRGIGGHRHYFHSQCLSRWAETSQGNWSAVTCPVCRGGVEETTVQLRRNKREDSLMKRRKDQTSHQSNDSADDDATERLDQLAREHLTELLSGLAPLNLVKQNLNNLDLSLVPNLSLRGAQLQGAQLNHACLVGIDLQEANLEGANMQGAQLQRAQLQGANLSGANLQGANLSGAVLSGAEMSNLVVTNLLPNPANLHHGLRGVALFEALAREQLF